MRTSKQIMKKEDLDFILNIKGKEIGTSLIVEMFGEFDGKCRFNPYDSLIIPPNTYGPEGNKNTEPCYTTVGVWVFNKYFIEEDLFHIFGYINETITKKTFGKINKKLSYALLEDDIDLEALKRYLMKTQKCMPYISVLSPSHTEKLLLCSTAIDKKKQQLLKQYNDDIKAGNEIVADKIEKELLSYARDLLKDDPAMDSYNSGARGSFDNNFKNMFVMKGAIKDPDPDKGYNIATSNYMDGIDKEEYAVFANSLSAGPYARANKTMIGGHWEKLFVSAFQHIKLQPKGTDCGTKRYKTITLTESNITEYMYSYVIEGSKLVEITSKNMDKYIGKTVKLRFSSLCENENTCSICAGNQFYRLNPDRLDIGIQSAIIPSTLKNLSMKSFHDSALKLTEIDAMSAFGLE